ncbi:efflux RND transporter periplasmic adaptor subunit [Rhodohalobacter sulfatireducens]|uniref:Efflux RND transporter periplasmic adaptor subunit n=1 Tax=Rhodohalobacter sulfatireducens TaxID=2911366 RepID=A0ABS9K851_9BACT|nr:efflux RND transporter periplasmic adaptor subunit [Rhodohalobacter sulfatireducens]MCG2587030.1 efflux RND transporter periplasmic adaptor subunit [Rhodohalobacter sulfatireducens]
MKTLYKSITTIILLTALISCGGGETEQTQFQGFGNFGGQEAISVEAMPVQNSTISEQVSAFGNIQTEDLIEIVPQVSNRIIEIHADLGDNVSRGQLLAEIYEAPFREAVQQAEAQVRQARATLDRDSTELGRQEQLFERDVISRAEYETARSTYLNSLAQFESAEATLAQSREDLENTDIVSPVYGVVLSRSVSEGDLATTGTTLFEIANLTGFETRVFLPIQDWERIEIGQPVSMALSTAGDGIAEGVVSMKSPRLDPTTGLGEVVISLTNTSSSVYQGALVQARINLQTKENVVVIPRSALVEKVETYIEPETGTIELQRSYSAFVTQGDTSAVRRDLELGIEQGDRIEVINGLEPGDQLVVTGQQSLEDGSPIQIAGSTPSLTAESDTTNTVGSESRRPGGGADSEQSDTQQAEQN